MRAELLVEAIERIARSVNLPLVKALTMPSTTDVIITTGNQSEF